MCMSNRAAGLVLKAHREAVNSLNGTGQSTVGAVAAVVAAANATAREATKDLQLSVKAAAAASLLKQKSAVAMDNIVLMKVEPCFIVVHELETLN